MERHDHNERMSARQKSEQSREVKQEQIQEKSPDHGLDAVALAAADMNVNDFTDFDDDNNSRAFHKQFVEAIFVKGISDATPSLITSKMQMQPPELTSERIKSHLQKFRKNQQREKESFLEDYDKWLGMIEDEAAGGNLFSKSLTGAVDGGGGGRAVAFLTYAVRKERQQEEKNERGEHGDSSATTSGRNPKRQRRQEMDVKELEEHAPTSSDTVVGFGGSNSRTATARKIPLPTLTEKEKSTGLGRSFLFICSLAQQMSQHVEHQRQMRDRIYLNLNDGVIGPTMLGNTMTTATASPSSNFSGGKGTNYPPRLQDFVLDEAATLQEEQRKTSPTWRTAPAATRNSSSIIDINTITTAETLAFPPAATEAATAAAQSNNDRSKPMARNNDIIESFSSFLR